MNKEMCKEILQKVIDTYGVDNQIDMCIEEMSELTKELSKIKRATRKIDKGITLEKGLEILKEIAKIRDNVIEEMADVYVTLAEQEMIFNCGDEIDKQVRFKLNRLKERLENE